MAKKKRAILNAATVLFAEKGFNETSTAELARMTKSAEGTIFYHFKTKTDLLLTILEDVREGIIREFQQYVGNRDFSDGMEMMEEVIAFFLYLAGHREEWFRLIQRHYIYEFARVNDACRGHLEAIYNAMLDLFEGAIRRGQADGSVRDLHPRKTALLIFSMVNGLVWLKNHDLYDTGTLYGELMPCCRSILASDNH